MINMSYYQCLPQLLKPLAHQTPGWSILTTSGYQKKILLSYVYANISGSHKAIFRGYRAHRGVFCSPNLSISKHYFISFSSATLQELYNNWPLTEINQPVGQ